jgi:hypothetical protein
VSVADRTKRKDIPEKWKELEVLRLRLRPSSGERLEDAQVLTGRLEQRDSATASV